MVDVVKTLVDVQEINVVIKMVTVMLPMIIVIFLRDAYWNLVNVVQLLQANVERV